MNTCNPTIDPARSNLDRLMQNWPGILPPLTQRFDNGARAAELMNIDTIGMEQAYLLGQIGSWFLRGATIADIERHAASAGDSLPFEGAERFMYQALLDTLAIRACDRAKAVRMVVDLAGLIDELLTLIQERAQLTRADVRTIFEHFKADSGPDAQAPTA